MLTYEEFFAGLLLALLVQILVAYRLRAIMHSAELRHSRNRIADLGREIVLAQEIATLADQTGFPLDADRGE